MTDEKIGRFSFYINNHAIYYADPLNGDSNYR